MRCRWAGLVMLAAGCAACGAESPSQPGPTAQRAAAIVHGAPTSHDPATVALVPRGLLCGARLAAFCTGALVAPRAILTAAHCLEGRRPADYRVFFGSAVDGPGTSLDVVAAVVHPAYDAITGANDVAVLTLGTPSGVVPVPMASAVDATLVGRTVRLVGFGRDDSGATGTARAGTAVVTSLDAGVFHYAPSPANTCGGDSGGPTFYDAGDGERLVGVTRSGDEACASSGTATRIDAVADFVAAAALATGSAPSPSIFGVGLDQCGSTCARDADCPLAMQCLNERAEGFRCGLTAGLQTGRFAAACSGDGDCGGGTCVSVGDDGCRCFEACAASSVAQVTVVGGGGCALAAGGRPERASSATVALGALALFRLLRARRRRRLDSSC
jgi:V8-like Glu-specific endopeptidase